MDLNESFHPKGEIAKTEAVPLHEHRQVGNVRLEHAGGRVVSVLCTHLTTRANDVGEFPGEVRAGELAAVRDAMARGALGVQNSYLVIFAGDFNVNVRGGEERFVLEGRLAGLRSQDPPLEIDTGLVSGAPLKTLRWKVPEGFVQVRDVFGGDERVAVWSSRASAVERCTSHNAERDETIDFIWASDELLVLDKSWPVCPEASPNADEPSDHIPLVVTFLLPTRVASAAAPVARGTWVLGFVVGPSLVGLLVLVAGGLARRRVGADPSPLGLAFV